MIVQRTTYRADIDGLRAIAVLSVLLFHLGTPGFSGGFVGVDVFFVISGYLITKLIKDGVEAGTFTFLGFYVRRARRLLPALFTVLAVCYVASFLLLSPEHLKKFGLSAAAASLSMSNIYFWNHSGYFDLADQFEPLLHTWSLSVEEQFYLLFPAFFVLCLFVAKRAVPFIIALGGIASLLAAIGMQDGHSEVLSEWSPYLSELFRDGPTTIFYIPIFRAFEFAIGAVFVWIPAIERRAVNEGLLAAGLALIGWSIATYDAKMIFPAANALPPCIGAGLCIYAGRAKLLGLALRNPLSVFIGKISYSVYLVHWPLLIFYRYYVYHSPTPWENVTIFVASIVLGYVSYRCIEQPFRRSNNRPSFGVIVGYASIGVNIALAGYVINSENGWTWRLDPNAQVIMDQRYSVGSGKAADYMGSLDCPDLCEFGNLNNEKIVIVAGDSHVDQYTKALKTLAPHLHFKLIQAGSCFIGSNLRSRPRGVMTAICHNAEAEMKKWIADPRVVAVVHAQRWEGYKYILETAAGTPVEFANFDDLYRAVIPDVLDLYKDFKGSVVFVNESPTTNLNCLSRPAYLSLYCPAPNHFYSQTFAAMLREGIALHQNIRFVDPADIICPSGKCMVADSEQHPLYSDEHHLSFEGTKLVVPAILEAIGDAAHSAG